MKKRNIFIYSLIISFLFLTNILFASNLILNKDEFKQLQQEKVTEINNYKNKLNKYKEIISNFKKEINELKKKKFTDENCNKKYSELINDLQNKVNDASFLIEKYLNDISNSTWIVEREEVYIDDNTYNLMSSLWSEWYKFKKEIIYKIDKEKVDEVINNTKEIENLLKWIKKFKCIINNFKDETSISLNDFYKNKINTTKKIIDRLKVWKYTFWKVYFSNSLWIKYIEEIIFEKWNYKKEKI